MKVQQKRTAKKKLKDNYPISYNKRHLSRFSNSKYHAYCNKINDSKIRNKTIKDRYIKKNKLDKLVKDKNDMKTLVKSITGPDYRD